MGKKELFISQFWFLRGLVSTSPSIAYSTTQSRCSSMCMFISLTCLYEYSIHAHSAHTHTHTSLPPILPHLQHCYKYLCQRVEEAESDITMKTVEWTNVFQSRWEIVTQEVQAPNITSLVPSFSAVIFKKATTFCSPWGHGLPIVHLYIRMFGHTCSKNVVGFQRMPFEYTALITLWTYFILEVKALWEQESGLKIGLDK